MKTGRLEILLGILVLVGGGYFAFHYFSKPGGAVACGPVQLSPEVKAYIDQKLSGPGAASASYLAPLNTRLEEFEAKFKALDQQQYLEANALVEKRRVFIGNKIREQRTSTAEIMEHKRKGELTRLRMATAAACAGITQVRSSPRSSGGRAGEASGAAGQKFPDGEDDVNSPDGDSGPTTNKQDAGGASGGQ